MITQEVVELKQKLQQKQKRGLVLDIDETLSWTIGYWVEKMQIKFGNPEGLSVGELVKKYRYVQKVPYWQTEEAQQWITEAVYSDSLQEELPLIENANHVVRKIEEIVPVVGYITVRPQEVINGTRRWFAKYQFPKVDIFGRPSTVDHKDGNKWKAKVLVFLYPEVMGIIDDNPSLVENLPTNYEGTVFLYDAEQTPQTDIRIIPCRNWDEVHEQVRRIYKHG